MKRGVFLFLAFLFASLSLWAMGNREAPPPAKTLAVEQGVAGKVEIWEGNFMPMIGGNRSGKITPAAGRRVRIHEPFNAIETGTTTAIRDTIPTPLIAEGYTDTTGQFLISLEVGTYSIFVEDNNGWYFNGWDGEGFQGLFQVDSGRVTTMDIRITKKAVF